MSRSLLDDKQKAALERLAGKPAGDTLADLDVRVVNALLAHSLIRRVESERSTSKTYVITDRGRGCL